MIQPSGGGGIRLEWGRGSVGKRENLGGEAGKPLLVEGVGGGLDGYSEV